MINKRFKAIYIYIYIYICAGGVGLPRGRRIHRGCRHQTSPANPSWLKESNFRLTSEKIYLKSPMCMIRTKLTRHTISLVVCFYLCCLFCDNRTNCYPCCYVDGKNALVRRNWQGAGNIQYRISCLCLYNFYHKSSSSITKVSHFVNACLSTVFT